MFRTSPRRRPDSGDTTDTEVLLLQRARVPLPRRRASPDSALAVVTGASSGIGQASARLLARAGRPTVVVARRHDALNDLVRELSVHAPSTALAVDVCDHGATKAAFAQILREQGPVRVLVNCAGAGMYRPFLEQEPADLRSLMDLHYFAAVTAIRAVLPGMLEQKKGHVVNIGSMSTKMGPWGHSGYTAAKAAVTALTQTLAADYAKSGVHFSVVHPGIVDTPYFDAPGLRPLRRRLERHLITPERVAQAVVRLIDRPRLEVCVPGHYRIVDAIRAVHPQLLHRLVAARSRPVNPLET